MPEAVRDRFQHRPEEVTTAVVESKTDNRPPRVGIMQGGLLAQEVRKDDETVGAGRERSCLLVEPRVRVGTGFGGPAHLVSRERSRKPLDEASARRHATVQIERTRCDVVIDE